MKIKLPVVLRSTYERETSELVKDIKVQESAKTAADKKIENLKLDFQELKNSSYFTVREKDREIEELKLELEKREKQIKGMEWCIQERDKVDKACEIEFVTRTITHEDIKKFMKLEDIIQLYTLIGIAGK